MAADVTSLVSGDPVLERVAEPGSSGRRERLLVMAHFIETGRVGGAEHGLYNIIRGLGGRRVNVGVVCGTRKRLDPLALAELERLPGVEVLEAGGMRKRFLAEQLACLSRDMRADAVLFPNYYVPPSVPRRLGRVAVVIHDLLYRHFPESCSRKRAAWLTLSQGWAVRRADAVIAISRFTADDLLRTFGRGIEGKLTVVPNPLFWNRLAGPDDVRPLERPYVLSVAAQYPHKNLETLIRAFAKLAAKDRDLMLVLCGQHYAALRGTAGGAGSLARLVETLSLADRVVMTGYISDRELGRWYRHAMLFAYPSVFEGFGVPPVEALGLGLPTLTTRCASLPEVTLGLAEYVDDPYSVEEWAERIEAIVREPSAARPSEVDARRLRGQYDIDRLGPLYLSACGLDAR